MEELYNDHGWKVILDSASLPDGRVKKIARVARADSVHIIAFASDTTILMLREYRPFYGAYIWMLPSGRADKETDMAVAAQRELQEETGFRAEELTHYCTTNPSESTTWANHLFIAKNLSPAPLPQAEEELIEVHTLGLEEALEKVLTSTKVHTVSAYGLLRYSRDHQTN